MSLLEDLKDEEAWAEGGYRECSLCKYIEELDDDETALALSQAAAGSISVRALTRVLLKNEAKIGVRTINRHRSEGHL